MAYPKDLQELNDKGIKCYVVHCVKTPSVKLRGKDNGMIVQFCKNCAEEMLSTTNFFERLVS